MVCRAEYSMTAQSKTLSRKMNMDVPWVGHSNYTVHPWGILRKHITEDTRECHNHEAQPSRGTKRWIEEETIMTNERHYETTDV